MRSWKTKKDISFKIFYLKKPLGLIKEMEHVRFVLRRKHSASWSENWALFLENGETHGQKLGLWSVCHFKLLTLNEGMHGQSMRCWAFKYIPLHKIIARFGSVTKFTLSTTNTLLTSLREVLEFLTDQLSISITKLFSRSLFVYQGPDVTYFFII